MIQEEVWVKKYQELMMFIETNHRNLLHHNSEKRGLNHNWLKQNRELLNTGKMKEVKVASFLKLLEFMECYRRKNQYE